MTMESIEKHLKGQLVSRVNRVDQEDYTNRQSNSDHLIGKQRLRNLQGLDFVDGLSKLHTPKSFNLLLKEPFQMRTL